MNVSILFDRLGPYHRARLDAVGARASVTAIEVAGESAEYEWDAVDNTNRFERTTLFPGSDSRSVAPDALESAVERALAEAAPDVVCIPGWSDPAALSALRWCLDASVPTVVMSASTAFDAPRSWWREAVKSRIVRLFNAGIGGGTPQCAYLETLGLPRSQVFTGYDVVDNEHFTTGADAARSRPSDLRTQLGLPQQYFVDVCRFIPKKNLPRLLQAFADYRSAVPEHAWDLVLLGDGPERARVERILQEESLTDAVHLPGFIQYDELPTYYGLASAFVHVSTTEQWGLVVNEAMASRLPVIVSEQCGCSADLVSDANGFCVDAFDTNALTARMVDLSQASASMLETMGKASYSRIADWDPAFFADQLHQACEVARSTPRTDASALDSLLLDRLARR